MERNASAHRGAKMSADAVAGRQPTGEKGKAMGAFAP